MVEDSGQSNGDGARRLLLYSLGGILICFTLYWFVKPALEHQPFYCRIVNCPDPVPPPPVAEAHSVEPVSIALAGSVLQGQFRLVKDPQGQVASKHYGGACVVFRPATPAQCTVDSDCTSAMSATFAMGTSECGAGTCWQKLEEAHCKKFKDTSELMLNQIETTSADIAQIRDALQPSKKNEPLVAALLSCYNASFDKTVEGPPCTIDPSTRKTRRVSTTTVPVN